MLYENSLVIASIKETLRDFNLPLIPVITEDTVFHDGRQYIKNTDIFRYHNNKLFKVGDYAYNSPILNLTKNFKIKSSVYDQYTHEYLGDYLRFLRDYKNINLLGMYNCFNGKTPTRIEQTFKDDNKKVIYSINTENKSYNYWLVPVKFNKYYTVGISSDIPYDITCILFNNMFISATPTKLISDTRKIVKGSAVNKPFIFSTYTDVAKTLWPYEKTLNLLIRIPNTVKTSITILEGDWTASANVLDGIFVSDVFYDQKSLPMNYQSKNSLLNHNNIKSYPFSNRLAEYILKTAIGPLDEINNNIERTHDSLRFLHNIENYGVWSATTSSAIYEEMFERDYTKGLAPSYSNEIIIKNNDGSSYLYHNGKYTDKSLIMNRYSDIYGYKFNGIENVSTYNPGPDSEGVVVRRFIDDYSDEFGYIDKDSELFFNQIINYTSGDF